MTPTYRSMLPALAVFAGLSGTASAQPAAPSQDAATALEAQIRTWLSDSTGGLLKLGDRAVQLTPNGDHYDVRVPLAGLGKVEPADAAVTATAKQLDDTHWQVDNQRLPAAFKVVTTEQVPDAPDAKNPNPEGKHAETVTYDVKVGDQTNTGTLDTSFATVTTTSGTIASLDVQRTGGTAPGSTQMGPFTSKAIVTPDGKLVSIQSEGSGTGYSSKTALPDGNSFTMTADKLGITSALTGLAREKLPGLLSMVSMAVKADQGRRASAPDAPLSPTDKAQLRALLESAKDLLTGGQLVETAEGVKFDFSGTTGSLSKGEITMAGNAPGGMLTATIGLILDGVAVDSLPPQFAAYVPSHFAMRPSVSNISVADLTQMGMAALAPQPAGPVHVPGFRPRTPAPVAAPAPTFDPDVLFTHGGIKVGYDLLEVTLADAQLTSTGNFVVSAPMTVTGQAEVKAKGLDGLIAKVQDDPMLAQGVPVLIFMKGIAKVDGDTATWAVNVVNQKVTVNGVDLSKMAGGLR